MSLDLLVQPQAQLDIDEHAAYLDDRTPDAGDRFLAELQHVFDRLVTFPGFGQPFPTRRYPDLRRVVLPSFPVSVFYRAAANAIIVGRVLHHSRDLPPLLEV